MSSDFASQGPQPLVADLVLGDGYALGSILQGAITSAYPKLTGVVAVQSGLLAGLNIVEEVVAGVGLTLLMEVQAAAGVPS